MHSAHQPKILSRQWREQVIRGGSLAIPSAAISGLCSLALAYTHRHPAEPYRSRNFLIAAGLAWAIYPFTALTILPINTRLFQLAEGYQADKIDDAQAPEVEALVQKWNFYSFIRGLFPLLSTLAAFEAL